jgi:tellurite resistance protein TerC
MEPDQAVEYFSAYLTEYALSVDNIFVILLILKYFQVQEEYYHRTIVLGYSGSDRLSGDLHICRALVIHKFT